MINITATKKYGDKVVLSVENLSFEEGKSYALIGANGSGKSTLLKILDRQLHATVEENIDKKQHKVAYMPQQSFAFSMSVKQNILLPAKLKSRKEAKAKMAELVSALGLAPYMKKSAAKLSGGETQRMALARTLMTDCDILLLDEPTAALDVEQAKAVLSLLEKEKNERNLTMIFATHSLKQAEILADEVLFLSEGKLAERGVPSEILKEPTSEELKNFISFNV